MPSKWCAAIGCQYSSKKLNELLKQPCFIHKGLTRQGCSCEKPYMFFQLPPNTCQQKAWKTALKLKDPPKAENFYVCSFHFVDKRPTEEHPTPELFLGYEKKCNTRRVQKRDASSSGQPQKTERKIKQHKTAETSHLREEIQETNEDPDIKVETNEELFPQSKATAVSSMDASTQWVDFSIMDHKYACLGAALFTENAFIQTERTYTSVAVQFDGPINAFETIIQSDKDSRFFTGIPKTALLTLIKRMEPYARPSFQMNISDQILMTLMKLKLNLMLYDISRRFSVSQSLVSRTLSFWIDTLAEHLTLNQEDVKVSGRIGSVHADRTSQRMQAFKIFTHKVPTTLVPKMNKILQICGALVTMLPDVIEDDTE